MANQWAAMNSQDAVAYDTRKETAMIAVSREILWRFIQPYLPSDKSIRILDVGGGTGIWALRLAQCGYQVVLSDISSALLDRARAKIEEAGLLRLVEIFQDDICDLKRYRDSSFGLVLAVGAPLSYCAKAHVALSEIRRVTIDSGFLVGDVENRFYGAHDSRRAKTWEDAKRILLEGIAYWPNADPPYPISEFSPSQLKELFERTNWHLDKLYPTNLAEALLPGHMLDAIVTNSDGMNEIVDLETRLREDASLIGNGFDLQFAVKKAC